MSLLLLLAPTPSTPESMRLARVAAGWEEGIASVRTFSVTDPAARGAFAVPPLGITFDWAAELRAGAIATADPTIAASLLGTGFFTES